MTQQAVAECMGSDLKVVKALLGPFLRMGL